MRDEFYARIQHVDSDYPVVDCRTCNDVHYVRWERPVGHLLFGKIRECPRECWKPKPKEAEPWWSKS